MCETDKKGSSSMISPEDVLESLLNDGSIDSLRLKIINQLKANGSNRFSFLINTLDLDLEPSQYVNVRGCNNDCDTACCYCNNEKQPPPHEIRFQEGD